MSIAFDTYVMLSAFVIGLVVGSFLNVVIHRLPLGRSVVWPGSHCPSCGAAIRFYDNIPLLSWIVLGGRCRDCRARIAFRYPLVELAAGLVGALSLLRWGWSMAGLEAALFGWASLALAVIDVDHRLLPDVITYPGIVLGLAASWAGGIVDLPDAVAGAAAGALLPTMVILLYRWLRGLEGMGWGDVKYLAAIGAVVGLSGCLQVLVLGAAAGALVGIGLIAAGRGSGQTELPFGTFLAAAVLFRLYAPTSWLSWIPW